MSRRKGKRMAMGCLAVSLLAVGVTAGRSPDAAETETPNGPIQAAELGIASR